MNIAELIERVKRHPDFGRAGMILCHSGVVRQTSRDGRRVRGLRIEVDHGRLDRILLEQRRRPGIVDVQVEIAENRDLSVGDDVMGLVVAGDIRENVIAVLAETLDQIKKTVTRKTEFWESS